MLISNILKMKHDKNPAADIDVMLESITGTIDYYRMTYLACFCLLVVSGFILKANYEDTKIKWMMIAQIFLAAGLASLVYWFEQKIEKAKNKKK